MEKSNINPQIAQEFFASARNAADRGQSQFFTPVELATALATALPLHRPTIVDLNCGAAHLLHGAANKTTTALLGADIDPLRTAHVGESKASVSRITKDLTLLYPLLVDVGWRADLFALNPPWGLEWYLDRLGDLAQSECHAVREVHAALLAAGPHVDSTLATLLIALDRCTSIGEGLLIANHATVHRLIFAPGAVAAPLAKHIWAHLQIPGNPMTGRADSQWQEGEAFVTSVLYFATGHDYGPPEDPYRSRAPKLLPGTALVLPDRVDRHGSQAYDHMAGYPSGKGWTAVRDHVLASAQANPDWHLWLRAGVICTHLSDFEESSRKTNKSELARLYKLNGKAPMQLVLQRTERDELLHVLGDDSPTARWRVHPALRRAVTQAVADYHTARAPLYPLPKIQRLGYLDEQDRITCLVDLAKPVAPTVKSARPSVPPPPGWAALLRAVLPAAPEAVAAHTGPAFRAGQSYALRTQTILATRTVCRPNSLTGEPEDIEYTGQQLAIYIKGEDGKDHVFLDNLLRANGTIITLPPEGVRVLVPNATPIDTLGFDLQQLCHHFDIPEVPDVSAANPAGYQANLQTLQEFEAFLNAA